MLESISGNLFPQWDIILDLHIKSYLDIFGVNANITEQDIMEIIEYDILCELSEFYEYSEIYMIFNLYSQKYKAKYTAVIAKLFLNDKVDFYIIDDLTQPTLSNYKKDRDESWIYFRDNFISKERFNAEDFCDTSWENPTQWSKYNINATITLQGTKYFNEILAPRFYNKYKDLEVEIDEKGNIIKWIGKINR